MRPERWGSLEGKVATFAPRPIRRFSDRTGLAHRTMHVSHACQLRPRLLFKKSRLPQHVMGPARFLLCVSYSHARYRSADLEEVHCPQENRVRLPLLLCEELRLPRSLGRCLLVKTEEISFPPPSCLAPISGFVERSSTSPSA